MGRKRRDSPYLDPYRDAVDRFGTGFEALLWNSREYQLARFRAIAGMIDLTGKVVADVGCGRADLLAWLAEQGIRYVRYIGVDGVPDLVEFCRARAEREHLAEAAFEEADFVTDRRLFQRLAAGDDAAPGGRWGAEAIVFSGSLNTLEQDRALEVVARAWRAVGTLGGAVVFNFLSTSGADSGQDTGPARRFDPLAMLAWALRQHGQVAFRQGYLGAHDATICLSAG